MAESRRPSLRQLADAAVAQGADDKRVAESVADAIALLDEDERYDGVDALAGEHDRWIAPFLRRVVRADPSHAVRARALELLGEHRSEVTRRFLLALLPDGNAWTLTRTAVGLLVEYPSDDTVDALVPLLDHVDVNTREAAIRAITTLARPGLAGLLQALARQGLEAAAVADALRRIDVAPAPPESDPLLCGLVARSMAELSDPDAAVRERALRRLVFVGCADLADRLLALLDDPDEGVRGAAAYHLGSLDDARVTPALFGLVRDDPSGEVRSDALRALASSHQRSAAVLDFLLDQATRAEIRASAPALCDLALALGDYEDERAIDALAAIVLDRDASVVARNTAADRLLERNRPALEPVWRAVAHERNAAGSTARSALDELERRGVERQRTAED